MKKILFTAILITFAYPTVSYASWWNPFSWNFFKQTVVVPPKTMEPISSQSLDGFKPDEETMKPENSFTAPDFLTDKEMRELEEQEAKIKAKKEDVLLWERLVLADEGYKILNPEAKDKVIKFFKTYKKYDPKYGTGEGPAYKQLDDKWWENFDQHKGDTADRLYFAHQELLATEKNQVTVKKNLTFKGNECLDEYCTLEIQMEIARIQASSAVDDSYRPNRSLHIDTPTSQSINYSGASSLSDYMQRPLLQDLSVPTNAPSSFPQKIEFRMDELNTDFGTAHTPDGSSYQIHCYDGLYGRVCAKR